MSDDRGHGPEAMEILREIKMLKAKAREQIAEDHRDGDDQLDADDDDEYQIL
ncbi:MAG: hypothetical protein OXF68_16455 [Gammaproteobacteria bacterium]|nr:hypothetical protein [Gammaproteobacteria bacterium]MCY4343427.1 hypothetical protein [Gammaproteobacteria bacterium]